ncbi:MAG: DUF1573 domain-containing protein [Bacteroidales bacterium]|nr:DUF1573 domain-containing protein [Bacteroidales bacterium]
MKKQVFYFPGILLFFICLAGCNQPAQTETSNGRSGINPESGGPFISFQKDVHDFGKIITGERVSYGFRFTNTGTSPLLITGIRSGCGCTVGDYPKDPVMPGKEGRIHVVFNSSGRRGFQSESVRVLSNAEESVVTLRITAEVMEQ